MTPEPVLKNENAFDFEQFRVDKNQDKIDDGQIEEVQEEVDLPDDSREFFDFEKYKVSDEKSKFRKIAEGFLRHNARVSSKVAETVVGFPGDAVNFVEWIGDKLPELPGWLEKDPNFLQQGVKKILKSLPTSSDIKDKISEITGGFTDPINTYEEFEDDVVSLATTLAFGKDPTKLKNIAGSIAKALTAKGAGETAKLLGFPAPRS